MTDKDFSEKYIPLSGSLYRIAFYLLESEQDAEDVLQDLYVKLWSRRDVLDSVENPKAYCFRLLKNSCIDHIREKSREIPGAADDNVPDDTDISAETESRDSLKRVTGLVGTLSAGQREVLRLKVIEDLSYEEISGITGMNYLTLRVLLSQARNKIKKAL